MVFYHGSASTFRSSILKNGLVPGGTLWYSLAKLQGRQPGNFGGTPSVWCCDSFVVASAYARQAAVNLRAKKGELIRPVSSYVQQYALVKASPLRDPQALPIVFAIELDEGQVVPASPGKFRVERTISPEHIRQVYGPVNAQPESSSSGGHRHAT